MTTPDDLITWGRQQLDDDERVARASATHGPHWKVQNGRIELDGDPQGLDVFEHTIVFDEGSPDGDQLDHIARHDPARILAEVDAKRRLIDDITAEQHLVVGDCWYTCTVATEGRDGGTCCNDNLSGDPCNCGRDARVARRLRLLFLPFADREGYREEWRP